MNPAHHAADCTLCAGMGDVVRYLGTTPHLETCPRCKGRRLEPQGLPPVTTTLSPPETR